MKKLKYRRWPFILGTMCLFVAVAFFLSNYYEDQAAGERSRVILDKIQNVIPEMTEVEKTQPLSPYNEVQPEQPEGMGDEHIIPDYILSPEMEMPTIEIDGMYYIGTLYFPALELELPVMSSWSYPQLKMAPCLYSGSIYKGNAVIAAHNYVSHFGNLSKLSLGDTACFTDVDGNVFNYKSIVQEVLDPTAMDEMIESDADLTLFTCTLGGASRFTVRFRLLKTPE